MLTVDLRKLRENAEIVVSRARSEGIEVTGITKGLSGAFEVGNALLEGGIRHLGDSRLRNLKRLRNHLKDVCLTIVRIPMISEVEELVSTADKSLVSEIQTVKALGAEALRQGREHRVILMVDIGDLREGVCPNDLVGTALDIERTKGVILEGIGTNTGCYGGIIPSRENTLIAIDLARKVERLLGRTLRVSGGNTATYGLLEDGVLPAGVTDLRIGEAILLGYNTTLKRPVSGVHQDAIMLTAEVVEIKDKPSMPIGVVGCDVHGRKPVFVDKGIRKRAIVAMGMQDVRIEGLRPISEGIKVLGASSDHTIVDVTESTVDLRVGDLIDFHVNYSAMLQASTSAYVSKVYLS